MTKCIQQTLLTCVSPLALVALLAPAAAMAQDNQARRDATAAATEDGTSGEDAADPRDIIVTGSRIITSGTNSPSDVTVATADQLLDIQPFSILQGLQALPALTGGNSTATGAGQTLINLRGLGSLRNLVLIDGRRIGPTQNGGTVALDVIPQALLQRVEVVSGGASAVYGSDAVTGVINFITDRKFNGLRIDLRSGISGYGDDAKRNASIAAGHDLFGGRGHIEASYEYRGSDGIRRGDRPYLTPSYSQQGSVLPINGVFQAVGSAANPYVLARDARLATSSFGGLINNGPLAGLNFTTNGVLSPFVHGALTGSNGIEIGGDGSYYTDGTVEAPQQVHQEFVRFDFDVSDTIHFFVQGAATQGHFEQYGQNFLINRAAIGYNNAFLATVQPQYQSVITAQRNANALGSFQFSKMETIFPQQHVDNQENYYAIVTGLDGKIGWLNWEAGYTRTVSSLKGRNDYSLDNGHYLAALNAVVVNGQTVCNAAVVNPTVYGGCVPLNIFGPTSEAGNQAALDYIRRVSRNEQIYKTDDASVVLRGAPFSLPAGPVGMALSGEYRKLTWEVTSNSPAAFANCTGIQFGCTATTSAYQGMATAIRTPVSQSVWEGAYEVNVPVFANAPFARELNVSGAVRYTNYSTSGDVWTWKAGVNWTINDDIRLRATRSRDIRAPNLNDLFAVASSANNQLSDLHTGITGSVLQVSSGNPDLKPEKADNITAGIVFTPQFLPGFSFSVDYYKVKINNAIFSIAANQIATQQACEASNGTSSVCSLYVRPLAFSDRSAANFPTTIYTRSVNVGVLETKGVDFEADYNSSKLGLRLLVNYQPQLRFDYGPAGIIDVAGAADGIGGLNATPKWRATASVNYNLSDALRVHLQERWRSSLKPNGVASLVFVANSTIKSIAYTDLTLNYEINKMFSLSFNVQNLFNQAPRPSASVNTGGQVNYQGGFVVNDDLQGRYMTVSLRLRM